MSDLRKDLIQRARQMAINRSIFELIKNNPKITREQIIDKLGISDRTVSRIIKKLQEMELIERIGARKTGYWQIKK